MPGTKNEDPARGLSFHKKRRALGIGSRSSYLRKMLKSRRGEVAEKPVLSVRTGEAAFDDLQSVWGAHGSLPQDCTLAATRHKAKAPGWKCLSVTHNDPPPQKA